MTTITPTRMYIALGALCATLVVVGSAAAELNCPTTADKGVPFHGTLHGAEVDVPSFPTLSVEGGGAGVATHLGNFEASWQVTVDIPTRTSTGTFEFIAANGDQLLTDIVGEGTGPPITHITECNTITGGTGRFAGATGEFAIHRVVDLSTGVTSGFFDGTIVMKKAK